MYYPHNTTKLMTKSPYSPSYLQRNNQCYLPHPMLTYNPWRPLRPWYHQEVHEKHHNSCFQALEGCWKARIGSVVCILTFLLKWNVVGGGSVTAGEGRAGKNRSHHDGTCACAEMQSHNLIPFTCLIIHFQQHLRVVTGFLESSAGLTDSEHSNIPFLLCPAMSLGPVSAPDHRCAYYSHLFLGCKEEICISKCLALRQHLWELCISANKNHLRT